MKNPFKFGTIVEDEFFTDREKECEYITRFLNSEDPFFERWIKNS